MRARKYTQSEVKQIFRSSKGKEPPPGTGWRKTGHADEHVNRGKLQLADDAHDHLRRNPNSAKSSLLSLDDMSFVAMELLNSNDGQARLENLDRAGPGATERFEGDVSAPVRVHFNMSGMDDDTRLIPWCRFVLLVAATPDGLYFHTCYADMSLE
jgi:hypothetical protein